MIKNSFKLYLKKRKERISISGISPRFDWRVLLVFLFIIFVIGTVQIARIYIGVNSGSAFEIEQDTSQSVEYTKKVESIKKVVESIPEKEKMVEVIESIENIEPISETFDETE